MTENTKVETMEVEMLQTKFHGSARYDNGAVVELPLALALSWKNQGIAREAQKQSEVAPAREAVSLDHQD